MKSNHNDPRIQELRAMQFANGPLWVYICEPAWLKAEDGTDEPFMNDGGPRELVQDCGGRVWFWGTYTDHLPAGAVHVGDGVCNGYDQQGNRLISVPQEWCRFLTEEEAGTAIACQEEDQKLLGYAR